ncbi:MAG: energy-coupling factor ABC transporter ATP-binding protein [PVC group bacterium]
MGKYEAFALREGMNADFTLTVSDLSYMYPNGVRALSSVNLRIDVGEKVAFIGPNGSGKSTLLLILSGLLEDGIRSGTVRRDLCGEEDTSGLRDALRTAFLFQNPDDQIIGTTVEDDVGFALFRAGIRPEEARPLIADVLGKVHLEGHEGRSPLEMSFGEKKRMCLAGCLAGRPEMLFLDEPALGLDPRETGQLLKILKETPTTMLLSSMDFRLVAELADRVVMLDRGKIVAHGAVMDILSDRSLMKEHGLSISFGEIELSASR